MPGMVRPRREREPSLPDDLRPHVERGACVFPRLEWQSRPGSKMRGASCHQVCLAINKINERTSHVLEGVSRFALRMAETFPDPCSDLMKWRVLLIPFLLRILVC